MATTQHSAADTTSKRRAQLKAIAEAYFAALTNKDFSAVPYDDQVVLRSPLAPPDQKIPYEDYPLQGKDAVVNWFQGLYPVLGEAKVIEHYFNEDLTVIATRADVGITNPPYALRVVDRFRITEDGRIIEQENHYDPRAVLPPSA